jgi:FtsH-binding integral membrane protein
MKLPNFRLYDTQATASMVLGLWGVVCTLMLAILVFKGFVVEDLSVTYDPRGGLGQFRKPMVFATTALVMTTGGVAGILGFRSLGQRRNSKQGRSWLGMTLGAIVVAVAPVMFFAWRMFSQPIIWDRG